MRWLFALLALAGCDMVLGLDRNPILDAPTTTEHDEDQDGIGDLDDTCPTVKGSQQDSDMDGVGDLCDPNPGIANRIAAFYPFDIMPAEFVPISGSWSVANDALVHIGGDNFSKLVARNGRNLAPPYVVEARFRFDTRPTNGEISVVAAWDAGGVEGTFCSIINAVETEVHAYNKDGAGQTQVSPLDFTATFTARLIVEPSNITCIMSSDKNPNVAASGSPPAVPTGFIGLEGRYANTTIDYVILYTR
jgi:hypothetical protein